MSGVREMDRARVGWWVVAALLTTALTFVVYSFLGTFVFGVFIYYATRPVYRRLERRIRPASLAAVVALAVVALPAILLAAYTFAVGLQEFNTFVETRAWELGQFEQYVEPYVNVSTVVTDPESLLREPNTLDVLRRTLSSATKYLGFIGNAALHLFVMVTIAFYLLRDDHRLAAWFSRRFSGEDGVLEAYARHVDRDFSHIFFGNILNAAFTGVIGAIAYGMLDFMSPPGVGIPYSSLLGLLTGVASLVPVVGMKLVYVPVAIYLTAQAWATPDLLWFPLVFVVISFVIVDVIPDLVLRPYVSGRGLHLGMVMLAYVFGPLLFGWYGLFLGPMLLVLLVHFVRLVLPELLAGQPIKPEVLDRDIWTAAETADREEGGVSDEQQLEREEDSGDGEGGENRRDGADGEDRRDREGGEDETDGDRGGSQSENPDG